jgi:hypothetical protein
VTLEEAVKQLDCLDEDAILSVRRPWSPAAECVVTPPAENLGVPAYVKEAGFDYFLEVQVAHEVLGVFEDKPPTDEEKLRVLIHYAENDAYPEWVYAR